MHSSPTLSIHALAAGHGDCLVIDYGTGSALRRVVVDGGTRGTYERLKSHLDSAPSASLELLVVSHIDSDHIGGALQLVEDEVASRFRDIWFNAYKHLQPDSSEALGARQGDRLTDYLETNAQRWNHAFHGHAARLDDGDAPRTIELAGGAFLTILSPRPAHLRMLKQRWELEVRGAGMVLECPPQQDVADRPDLERMGAEDIDVERLAGRASQPDTSIANASSIAFIFEFAGKKLLCAADALADVLVNVGRKLSNGAPIPVDVFKLPHHASQSNVSTELLRQFPATTYVVSTNGACHGHPDDEALARVVVASPTASIKFNYDRLAFRRWKEVSERGESRFTVACGNGDGGISIHLLP